MLVGDYMLQAKHRLRFALGGTTEGLARHGSATTPVLFTGYNATAASSTAN